MDKHKLGIIVPYRNRYEHLNIFKQKIVEYLESNCYEDYVILIVEQDNAKLFNRGMLLNIGFEHAKKLGCDYVVFHDVDMIPEYVNYSYVDKPIHLATDFILEDGEKHRVIFDEYFGGVTLFPIRYFESIDGYSNKYWGWGYEDDDLLLRAKLKELPLNTATIKNYKPNGKALKFNGTNSYVKIKNTIDFRSDFTIFISFYPDSIFFNDAKPSDEFTVFSIPGYDLAISYTSFLRYNFCMFDSEHTPYFVNSNIKPNYKTNMAVTYDAMSKVFRVYQDGQKIGETGGFKRMFNYKEAKSYYIGVGNPLRETIPNYFNGYINIFAQFNSLLSDAEIFEVSNNEYHDLRLNKNSYVSSSELNVYYDANYIEDYKLTDLSNHGNDGIIINCEITDLNIEENINIKVPYRRKSLFKSLKHDENGFDGSKWKDIHTRYNQLRFNNEVLINPSLIENDGLSTLKYTLWGKTVDNNVIHLNVGI
jgi:hypothetical protein